MRPILLILCLSWVVGPFSARGQDPAGNFSNQRQKWITVIDAPVSLDTLSIVPGSIRINGLSDSLYSIDYVNAVLTWIDPPPVDSIFIRYRVFSGKLNAVSQRLSYDSVMNKFIGKPFTPDFGTSGNQAFFDFGNISYNGSFGRGISFGNSQDAVVTSNLNLQLNGYLADSIEIAAAITDNNIPIQPDGTTQQLNEFDRIYLSFRKKGWQLSLGDIDIRQNQSYYVSFYKRLQGIAFETTSSIGKNSWNKTLLSGSIAKGKFTRNVFQGQEGNQGPYRLTGANNEFFFVVLANTERVFIDGELLQRGEDQDYVINYNTAEIAFTPNRMITKDSRIQVEFEYSDRNYLNANLYAYNETSLNEKVKVRLSAFSNSDSKNSPINQTLDPRQRLFLDSLGNNIQQAFYPHELIEEFSAGKILYKKVDTVIDNVADSIYIFSTHPDSARYALSFIDVGQGNGDYLPDFNGANGKVYKWISPNNGIKQGRFEPAIFLVTPKKQQVFSLGTDYAISKSTLVTTEVAMSNYDVNSFSAKGNNENKGYAGKLILKNTTKLSSKSDLLLHTEGLLEYAGEKFRPLERLRSVEFYRDWGMPMTVRPEDEILGGGSLRLSGTKTGNIKYEVLSLKRGNSYSGIRNTISQEESKGTWKFNNSIRLTNFNTETDKGYFFRPILSVSKQFDKLARHSVFVNYSKEHNEVRSKFTDSIELHSFSFSIFQTGIRSPESNPQKWALTYFTRTDAHPLSRDLVKTDRSQNIKLEAELLKSEKRQLKFNTTYRNLKVFRNDITNNRSDKSLLGRTEYQFSEWKGFVSGNLLYEVGSGQEQKRDYAFMEVPAGQGEYTWNDYDSNGVQSLNEFEIAQFSDQAKFIRIFTPTNEFIKANYNTFNYSVALNPKTLLSSKKSFTAKFFTKINIQSSLQVSKKEQAKGLVQFNPFSDPVSDSSLITLSEIAINTFSFNRFSTRWGFDISNSRNSNRSLLTYGYESRKINEWSIKGRFNLSRSMLVDLTSRTGENQLSTSNIKFDNRNYLIRMHSLEPRITFTRKTNFRLIGSYRFRVNQNKVGEMERAVSHAFSSETKYNILQSTSLLGKFTFNNISFTAANTSPNANSTTSYILLEGLMPGKNFLWTLDLTKRLTNSLEMNIQYEGRKAGSTNVIHIGRASVRALL